ncbi:NAD(P)-binding domain-containing protein [Streptomyces flaveolus]|uniref:NAD(P)-binding domain-containing protein n=1 Tax=Streptomyces flaveolus TaxID=67297 RepID=UPI00167140D7|nr:NAD(P)-binding domain-containing protein [Streptomyces flaveolus]GGQ91801.1 3-hydroxyisobutyrate dehydrogenase [Streptomyces flaveolus]
MGSTKKYDVLVIGCGLMGSALARTLAGRGYSVAAWNRSPHRALALAESGVSPVDSPVEAVPAARICIACTNTYESTRSALQPVTDWDTTTLVNLGSGSADEAEEMARWAGERGAAYLDGFIGSYPKDIGSPHGMVAVSGPAALWEEHQDVFMSLGGASQHLSDEVRGAGVLEGSMVGTFFIAALSAYVEAATYAIDQGLTPKALASTTAQVISLLEAVAPETAEAIAHDSHETDQATLKTFAEGARATLTAMRAAGYSARVVGAVVENLELAERSGFAGLAFSAQSKVLTDTGRAAG